MADLDLFVEEFASGQDDLPKVDDPDGSLRAEFAGRFQFGTMRVTDKDGKKVGEFPHATCLDCNAMVEFRRPRLRKHLDWHQAVERRFCTLTSRSRGL